MPLGDRFIGPRSMKIGLFSDMRDFDGI